MKKKNKAKYTILLIITIGLSLFTYSKYNSYLNNCDNILSRVPQYKFSNDLKAEITNDDSLNKTFSCRAYRQIDSVAINNTSFNVFEKDNTLYFLNGTSVVSKLKLEERADSINIYDDLVIYIAVNKKDGTDYIVSIGKNSASEIKVPNLMFKTDFIREGNKIFYISEDIFENNYNIGLVSIDTENIIWEYENVKLINPNSFDLVNNRVLIVDTDGKIKELSSLTGEVTKEFNIANELVSAPIFNSIGDIIVWEKISSNLKALNETGEIKWEISIGNSLINSPIVVDNNMLIGTQFKKLFLIDIVKGEIKFTTNSSFDNNNTNYFLDEDLGILVSDGKLLKYYDPNDFKISTYDLGDLYFERNASPNIVFQKNDNRILIIRSYDNDITKPDCNILYGCRYYVDILTLN